MSIRRMIKIEQWEESTTDEFIWNKAGMNNLSARELQINTIL